MNESFRIGRIAGVAVGCNWSVLVVFWLIAWSLAAEQFPDAHPGYSRTGYWVAGVVTAVVFFASLLAHELGHAVVARRLGMKVEGITLWLFGGVAKLGGDAATPQVEWRVGAVGPGVSLVAAGLFGAAAVGFDAVGMSELVVAIPAWLARINLILAVFNLVPAYPLDGGRVLRALLWQRHDDRVRATISAARAGRTFAYVLIGLGLAEFALGVSAGGLWFVFLGWFLLSAARAEEAGVTTNQLLDGVRVKDVMSADPVTAPASMTVAELLDGYILSHRFSAFPLIDDDGGLVGLLTLSRLKGLPAAKRSTTPASRAACPISEVPTADPDEPVIHLLERIVTSPDGRALVLDEGRLVGIVSPTDISRVLQFEALRRPELTGRVTV